MSKIARVFQKQFAVNAGASDIGVFGSLAASNKTYSKDPATIQSLSAFLTGWAAETIATNRPALEDFNAVDFLAFYQLCYLLQTGVPEWDASTTYYIGSVVNNGTGTLYKSLVNDNLNNALTDGTKWGQVVPTSIDGSILANLAGIVSGAGIIPSANLPGSITQVAGTTDISTSSATYVDMTNMSITVPVTGKYQIVFNAYMRGQDGIVSAGNFVAMNINGSVVNSKNMYLSRVTNTTDVQDATLVWSGDLVAGQVVKIQWKMTAGYTFYQDGSLANGGNRVLQLIRIS